MFVLATFGLLADAHNHALELETWLHSGVLVSTAGDSAAAKVLSKEKEVQVYRYLFEYGIRMVEFVSAENLVLEKFDVTESDVRRSVENLVDVLSKFRKSHPESASLTSSQIKDKTNDIIQFSSEQQANAVRHIREMAFLLERYESLLQRWIHLQDLDEDTNYMRTPWEEMVAVAKTLFGEPAHVNEFDLSRLAFDFNADDGVQFKLLLPHKADVLHIFDELVGSAHVSTFRERVTTLSSTFETQYRDYATWNLLPAGQIARNIKMARHSDNTLGSHVQAAITLRKLALDQYKLFKMFLSNNADDGVKQVMVFLYDPEKRGAQFDIPTGHASFGNAMDAVAFYRDFVKPSFDRVPKAFYSGRLEVVLLVKKVGVVQQIGKCFREGRQMMLSYGRHYSLIAFAYAVAHECGHVLDYKLGLRIRNRLMVMTRQQKFDRLRNNVDLPFKDVLIEADEAFVKFIPMDGRNLKLHDFLLQQILDLKLGRDIDGVDGDALKRLKRLVEQSIKTDADMEIIVEKRKQLRGQIEQYDLATKRLHAALVETSELPSHVSYYSTRNWGEDAAELASHLMSGAYRDALLARTCDDSALRDKIAVWLDEFGGDAVAGESASVRDERISLATEWKTQFKNAQPMGESTVTVVTHSLEGAESIDVLAEVDRFIAKQSSTVAWVDIREKMDDSADFRVLSMTTAIDPTIHVFGVDHATWSDFKLDLPVFLHALKWSPSGQLREANEPLSFPEDKYAWHPPICVGEEFVVNFS